MPSPGAVTCVGASMGRRVLQEARKGAGPPGRKRNRLRPSVVPGVAEALGEQIDLPDGQGRDPRVEVGDATVVSVRPEGIADRCWGRTPGGAKASWRCPLRRCALRRESPLWPSFTQTDNGDGDDPELRFTRQPAGGLGPQRLGVRMNRPSRPGSSASTPPMTVATTIMNAHADSQLNNVNATPRRPNCCWLEATRLGR
jgi:hypothetical protein